MSLALLAIIFGTGLAMLQLHALLRPEEHTRAMRQFPRSINAGYLLVGVGTIWFLYYVNLESVADFAHLKKHMLWGFGALGVMTCIFVKDFLAVRGLAVVLLLLAKLTLDSARWVDSEWRLVLVAWAYLWVVAGIWLTIAPWRLRDLIHWVLATPRRFRVLSSLGLGFGLFVLALGLFVL